MKVTSKIKTMFSNELLRYIASVCDTRRIPSNNQKMIILCNLLYTYGIDFEILGGATNRIALQIDGYAVKFAMDEQGYLDNLIEYSLSPELQPYVTKSYETNGYIQVQECVEAIIAKETFRVYRVEIMKILDTLCQDYLLGDVGYIDKNRTNWGIRDGKPVILDYAYCHRATENLFTCSSCGSALKYDSSYDKLMCSDRSGCKAIYTYNERKRIQGKAVDVEMVKERKAESIRLVEDEVTKDIECFEDKLIGDNYFIIDCPADEYAYKKLKEERKMRISINGGDDDDMITMEDRLEAMVRLARNPNDEEAKKVFSASYEEEKIPEPLYTNRYEEEFRYGGTGVREYNFTDSDEEDEQEEQCGDEFDMEEALDDMVERARRMREQEEATVSSVHEEQEKAYIKQMREKREPEKKELPQEDKDLIQKFLDDNGFKVDANGFASKEGNTEESEVEHDPTDLTPERVETQKLLQDTEKTENEHLEELHSGEDSGIYLNGKPISIGQEVEV